MTALGEALGSIARFLETRRIPYMLIGGIANIVWGESRSTLDVDATVLVEESSWPGVIADLRRQFRIIPAHPLAFLRETNVLPIETPNGTRIDLIWAQLPYEHKAIARAVVEEAAGVRVRVCRAEDLIIHKLVSDRPKDREDVRGIVRQQASRLDRAYLRQTAREFARDLDRPDLLRDLDTWLKGNFPKD